MTRHPEPLRNGRGEIIETCEGILECDHPCGQVNRLIGEAVLSGDLDAFESFCEPCGAWKRITGLRDAPLTWVLGRNR